MNFQKKIRPLLFLLGLFFAHYSLLSQTDTSKIPAPKRSSNENPVFSSKSSVNNNTLDDGTILENLPPPKKPMNALFAEVFTNGGVYSLNYDRILLRKEKMAATIRTGVFFYPKARGTYETSIVLEPNVLIGNEKFFFESGIGFTRFIILEKQSSTDGPAYKQIDWENYFSLRAGIRIQNKDENGLFFRAGLTPIFYYMDQEGSGWYGQLLGGVGFGVSF